VSERGEGNAKEFVSTSDDISDYTKHFPIGYIHQTRDVDEWFFSLIYDGNKRS